MPECYNYEYKTAVLDENNNMDDSKMGIYKVMVDKDTVNINPYLKNDPTDNTCKKLEHGWFRTDPEKKRLMEKIDQKIESDPSFGGKRSFIKIKKSTRKNKNRKHKHKRTKRQRHRH